MMDDFLKILKIYELKGVSRNCSNFYHCDKENIDYQRKETTAEHVYSCTKLADYFLYSEKEFFELNRLKVYDLLHYHDDIEIATGDDCISNREKRMAKQEIEKTAIFDLASKYPKKLEQKLLEMDKEFRDGITPESKFAHAIDKMDAMVHELNYPKDWGPKNFTEKNVITWFKPAFDYSFTFSKYFERVVQYLNANGYFDVPN